MTKLPLSKVLFLVLTAAGLVLLLGGSMAFWDPVQLRSWLESSGAWALPAFLLLQIIQVLVFWIPGEVIQVAGGMFFGLFHGTVLNILGMALGGQLAFFLARLLGRSWVEGFLEKKEFRRMIGILRSPQLSRLLFLLFLLPFLPKDALCWLAGLSNLTPWRFFWVTTLARIPSLILSSLVGASLLTGQAPVFGAAILGAVGLVAVVGFFRKEIFKALLPRHAGMAVGMRIFRPRKKMKGLFVLPSKGRRVSGHLLKTDFVGSFSFR